jgi:hypothetical protein
MKGKHARDTIFVLDTEDQRQVTSDYALVDTVHKHFSTVFTSDAQVE